jgi:hypothetical protein
LTLPYAAGAAAFDAAMFTLAFALKKNWSITATTRKSGLATQNWLPAILLGRAKAPLDSKILENMESFIVER